MSDLNPLDALQLERERTLFMFYGYRWRDGRTGGGYFKLAHSLSEALADLHANPGVATRDGSVYLVRDAFLEVGEEDGDHTIHVELVEVPVVNVFGGDSN